MYCYKDEINETQWIIFLISGFIRLLFFPDKISYIIQIYFPKVYFTVTFSKATSVTAVQLNEMYHAQTLR